MGRRLRTVAALTERSGTGLCIVPSVGHNPYVAVRGKMLAIIATCGIAALVLVAVAGVWVTTNQGSTQDRCASADQAGCPQPELPDAGKRSAISTAAPPTFQYRSTNAPTPIAQIANNAPASVAQLAQATAFPLSPTQAASSLPDAMRAADTTATTSAADTTQTTSAAATSAAESDAATVAGPPTAADVHPTFGTSVIGPSTSNLTQTSQSSTGTSTMTRPSEPVWPGEADTGVPAGVGLAPYAGPIYIDTDGSSICPITTPDTLIDRVTMTCTVVVEAPNLVIRNSQVQGAIFVDSDRLSADEGSVTIEDSDVNAGTQNGAAISNGNITIRRSEIQGGQTIVQCTENSSSCTIEDSWLHGQSIPPMTTEPHLGGFLSSGGSNILLRHNQIACDNPNGCTGDIVLLPDFGPLTNVTVEDNLLAANELLAYCTYAGWRPNDFASQNSGIVYRHNVFERGANGKCGTYGPVTGWRPDPPGNIWLDNIWDDGTLIAPEG